MALTDIDGGRLANNAFSLGKNLIINGAMQVAQRATQVTGVTAGGYLTCDRFRLTMASLGTWTVDQDTNAPDGFSNSFKVTCTTADASPAANDNVMFRHIIEAQNLQALAYGTSGAKAITLSFWVRSNKTGNASLVAVQNDNSNKMTSFQYSISSADTWEYKTITIPGDTAGVINNDNGEGMLFEWWLNSGSTFTGGSHQATWSTFTNANRNVSNFGLGGATSDYWQITGVQLEVGSVATPFEHRSYGDELRKCQRYYQRIQSDGNSDPIGIGYNEGSTEAKVMIDFPVTMRIPPSALETTGTASDYEVRSGTTTNCSSVPTVGPATTNCLTIIFTLSGLTGQQANQCRFRIADVFLGWSAEL